MPENMFFLKFNLAQTKHLNTEAMVVLPENDNLRLIVDHLIEIAKLSTCKRSKCGSVIVVDDSFIIGDGYNSMPCNVTGECFKENLSPTFKSDKTCCVHAEQRAIMDALKGRWNHRIKGSMNIPDTSDQHALFHKA